MRARRDPLPALEQRGIAPEWLMGVGILLVIVGAIMVAVHMGSSLSGSAKDTYGTGGTIAVIGIASILRGMFRIRG